MGRNVRRIVGADRHKQLLGDMEKELRNIRNVLSHLSGKFSYSREVTQKESQKIIEAYESYVKLVEAHQEMSDLVYHGIAEDEIADDDPKKIIQYPERKAANE